MVQRPLRKVFQMKFKHALALALILIRSCVPLPAATVVYHAEHFGGTRNNRAITYELLSDSTFHGTNLVFGTPLVVTPVLGGATNYLLPGNYTLKVDGSTRFAAFNVPDSTNVYNVIDLITNGLSVNYPPGLATLSPGSNVTMIATGGVTVVSSLTDTGAVNILSSAIAATVTNGFPWNALNLPLAGGTMTGSITNARIKNPAGTAQVGAQSGNVQIQNPLTGYTPFSFDGVTASYFGDAAGLTNLSAGNLASGTVPLANIAGLTTNQTDIGTQMLFTNLHKAFRIPQQFGAVGDGTTDDTAALQRWLNYCSSNHAQAVLPPAPGGYYKITDVLYVTNGIYLTGGGGGKHTTSGIYSSKAQIRQFTRNKHALRLLNAVDSLRIDNVLITADPPNNFTNTACYGIYFDGGSPDSDCSLISQVGVQNFGIGFYGVSLADSKFTACSPGYNAIGIYVEGVANNITLENCQVSYNWSNQVRVSNCDGLVISGCDIAAEHAAAQGVYLQNGVYATIYNSRFEDFSTNHMVVCGSTNGGWGVQLTVIGTGFYNYTGDPGTNRAAICATNAAISIFNSYPNRITYTARDVRVYNSFDPLGHIFATPPIVFWDTFNNRTNMAFSFATNLYEYSNSIPANGIDGIKLASRTVTGDKVGVGTITATNTVGATLSYILPSGDSISFSNGLMTALTPVVWDTDALAYFTLAGINNITQKVAVNYLATQSKAIGYWTNTIALYPVTGDYMSNAVYNLRTNAFHMVNHSCTYSSTGIVVRAASSAYMDTLWTPTTANIAGATKDSIHLGIYLEDTSIMPVGSITVMGMYDDFARLSIGYNFASFGMAGFSANNVVTAGGPYMSTNVIGDVRGPVLGTRTGSAAQALYFKTLSTTTTDSSSALAVSAPVAIGARNQYGGQSQFANMTFAGASIGAGINSTMAAQVQAMWDAYNLILGRKVP